MKTLKTRLTYLLTLTMILSAILIPRETVSAATIKDTYHIMYVGDTYTPKVSGSTSKATWGSYDNSIATVSKSGKITAKKVGETSIYLKTSSGYSSVPITVKSKVDKAGLKNLKITTKKVKTTSNSNASKIVVTMKNNNKSSIALVTYNITFYDKNKKEVATTYSDDITNLEAGKSYTSYVTIPTKEYSNEYYSYSSYNVETLVTMKASDVTSYLQIGSFRKNIKYTIKTGKKEDTITFKNTSAKDLKINYSALYYKSGKLIDCVSSMTNVDAKSTEKCTITSSVSHDEVKVSYTVYYNQY